MVIPAPASADGTEKTIPWIGVVDKVHGENVYFTLATKKLENKCVPKNEK